MRPLPHQTPSRFQILLSIRRTSVINQLVEINKAAKIVGVRQDTRELGQRLRTPNLRQNRLHLAQLLSRGLRLLPMLPSLLTKITHHPLRPLRQRLNRTARIAL